MAFQPLFINNKTMTKHKQENKGKNKQNAQLTKTPKSNGSKKLNYLTL
jgi:hypothetical protein